jgi:6,7-dimethyl-8-ribityllumazine synthase
MAGPLKSSTKVINKEVLKAKRIAIVVAKWNDDITDALYLSAYGTLTRHGIAATNIELVTVPGSFELTLGAQFKAVQENIDAVICLGCVIQGETPHFDYICQAVANGITNLNIKFNKPVIFGVLTTLNKQQALDRAGGKYGNKGEEAALTAIEMLLLKK